MDDAEINNSTDNHFLYSYTAQTIGDRYKIAG